MLQQTFRVFKNIGNDYYHSKSNFGSWNSSSNSLDSVAVVPNQPMEFLIFNGKGSKSLSFEIGAYSKLITTSDSRRETPGTTARNPVEKSAAKIRLADIFNNDIDWPLDILNPPDLDPTIPPGGGGGGGSHYNHAKIKVELFRPKEEEPIKKWTKTAVTNGDRSHKFTISSSDEDGVLVLKKPGWWRCRVTILDGPADLNFLSTSFIRKAEYSERFLTKRWLKHAFWNVLSLLAPEVSIYKGVVRIKLAEEVANIMNTSSVNETISLYFDGIDSNIFLSTINIEIKKGSHMIEHFNAKFENARVQKENFERLHDENSDENKIEYQRLKAAYNRWKDNYDNVIYHVKPNDAVLEIIPLFSQAEITYDNYSLDARIEFDRNPSIFIKIGESAFGRTLCFADVNYTIKTDLIAGLIASFVDDKEELVNNLIEKFVNEYGYTIRKYLYQALGKACGYDSIVERLTATNKGWKVSCYREIAHPDPTKPYKNTDEYFFSDPADLEGVTVSAGDVLTARDNASRLAGGNGAIDTDDLRKLDKVDTIVVIMMENRSFDHLLGNLHKSFPNVGYTCFNPGFTNPPSGNFVEPIYAEKAADIFYPDPQITPISPEHSHSHVMRQISDGKYDVTKPLSERDASTLGLMQGFTADIQFRFNEVGGNLNFPGAKPIYESPQLVMSYQTEHQIPFYYELAKKFKVLDHWFSAHPGATWPNRIAMVTGRIIELDNFSITDPRLGYFKEKTIFDVLNKFNVDWRYLESNVSITRIFDNFRTDDKNVIPLHKNGVSTGDKFELSVDDFAELDALLEKDTLPRVIFIDPRFSDAPPFKMGCDDIPPVSLANGQAFIEEVYSRFRNSAHWNKLMMLITYDEHGGFFDHVAPPGTPHSDHPNPVPPLYYDKAEPDNIEKIGPTHMGVRVPTFLISPFVKAKSVSHIVFDHTSILKTILLHNREKIPTDVMTTFGERVVNANHLGMALDEKRVVAGAPRTTVTRINAGKKRSPITSSITKNKEKNKEISPLDFHHSLNSLFNPKK